MITTTDPKHIDLPRLKQAVPLLDLARERGLDPKRHGHGTWKVKCPLHEDAEASLVITPSKNLWHCLGCGRGGSNIDFVAELDLLSTRDAILTLAGKVTGEIEKSEIVFSWVTLRALLRLYQVDLHPLPDGRWSGRHPFGVRPGSALILSADGGNWSTNDTPPIGGDRLDLVAAMECVTRERAAELLHGVFPAILEREGIPDDGGFVDESNTSGSDGERLRTAARHAATQLDTMEGS